MVSTLDPTPFRRRVASTSNDESPTSSRASARTSTTASIETVWSIAGRVMVVVGARSAIVSNRYRIGSRFSSPNSSRRTISRSPPRSSRVESLHRVGSAASTSSTIGDVPGTVMVRARNSGSIVPAAVRSMGIGRSSTRSSSRSEPSSTVWPSLERRSVPGPSSDRTSPRPAAYAGGPTTAVADRTEGAGRIRIERTGVSSSSVSNAYWISSASVSTIRSNRPACCRVSTRRCQSLASPSPMRRIRRKTRSDAGSPRTRSAAIASGSPRGCTRSGSTRSTTSVRAGHFASDQGANTRRPAIDASAGRQATSATVTMQIATAAPSSRWASVGSTTSSNRTVVIRVRRSRTDRAASGFPSPDPLDSNSTQLASRPASGGAIRSMRSATSTSDGWNLNAGQSLRLNAQPIATRPAMRITQRSADGNRKIRSARATTTTDAITTETIAEAWRSTTVRRIVRRIFSILGMISSVRDIVRGVSIRVNVGIVGFDSQSGEARRKGPLTSGEDRNPGCSSAHRFSPVGSDGGPPTRWSPVKEA